MSKNRRLQFSDEDYEVIQHKAEAQGQTPKQFIIELIDSLRNSSKKVREV